MGFIPDRTLPDTIYRLYSPSDRKKNGTVPYINANAETLEIPQDKTDNIDRYILQNLFLKIGKKEANDERWQDELYSLSHMGR